MNRLIGRTLKWVSVLCAAVVLLCACSKDDDSGWLTLDSGAVLIPGLGQSATMGYVAERVKRIKITSIPAGWKVDVDESARLFTVTAPDELGGDSQAVRSGSVAFIVYTDDSRALNKSFLVSVVDEADITDMRANCVVVSKPYTQYTFDITHRGETSETLSPARAAIIWQTASDLVRELSYADGKVTFYADGRDDKLIGGNALLGAYDGDGTLLATWHLWFVDASELQEQTYANGRTFMSLNLGAQGNTNTSREEILSSFGTFYQWGRKEPFVGPAAYNAADGENHYMYDGAGMRVRMEYIASTAQTGTQAYASEHPLDFILGVEESGFDWRYADHSDALWGAAKSEQDPCPKGWRVPSKEDFAGLTIVDMTAGTEEQFGWMLTDGQVKSFYPAAGFRTYLRGTIQNVYNPVSGVDVPKPWTGYYWTGGVEGARSSAMFFWLDAADVTRSGVEQAVPHYRANGMQVRCVKQ